MGVSLRLELLCASSTPLESVLGGCSQRLGVDRTYKSVEADPFVVHLPARRALHPEGVVEGLVLRVRRPEICHAALLGLLVSTSL